MIVADADDATTAADDAIVQEGKRGGNGDDVPRGGGW